jgi:hypothetical protein
MLPQWDNEDNKIVIYCYKKIYINKEEYYSNSDTQFTLHTLRSLSPNSVITDLHIFLSLTYAFLLMAVLLL